MYISVAAISFNTEEYADDPTAVLEFDAVQDKYQPERNDGLKVSFTSKRDDINAEFLLTNTEATDLRKWLDHHGY